MPAAASGAEQAAAFQAIGNTATSGLGFLSSLFTNKSQRKWQEKQYDKQRRDALADWNMQNEYDSPSAQMQRLKAAGLNPNLVYGNGADAGMAGPVRSSETGSWQPKAPNLDGMFNGMLAYMDVSMKEAQIDNLKAMNTVLEQDKFLKAAQVANTLQGTQKLAADTDMQRKELEYRDSILKASVDAAKLQNQKTQTDILLSMRKDEREAMMTSSSIKEAAERILNMRSQRATDKWTRHQIAWQIDNLRKDNKLKELDINLKKMGIQPGDPAYMRILSQYLGDKTIFDKEKVWDIDTNKTKVGGTQWRANNP